jgi:DNA mismatch repair protein MutH
MNKGWAGLTLEAYLGLPPNSRREPNAGSWELKQASLVINKRTGEYKAKETIQITMFDWKHVVEHPFEDSHVLHKIGRMVIAARLWIDKNETRSPLVIVRSADISLENPGIYNGIKEDYENVREFVRKFGYDGLKNKGLQRAGIRCNLIEQRTKGQKSSDTRAWYVKKPLVNILVGITSQS